MSQGKETYEGNLWCLKKDHNWIHINNSRADPKYTMVYAWILNFLNKNVHGKGSSLPTHEGNTYENESIFIKIVLAQSHRHCSVLCCMQYDRSTNGMRYLVYGIRRPGYEDYGIGTNLEGFGRYDADKYIPTGYKEPFAVYL